MPSINLQKLENILRRETACVSSEDVPILMTIIHDEVGEKPPQRLLDETHQHAVERGDA